MSGGDYSFIDIAVLDPVRERFAAGEALLLLTVDLDLVLWANGPGAALVNAHDLIAAVGMDSGLSSAAIRQIKGAPGYHRRGSRSQLVARIGGKPAQLTVERVELPKGQEGILLGSVDSDKDKDSASSRAIAGFAESGQYLAIVDNEATVIAATEGFEPLGFSRQTLAQLVADVRTEHDRLLKRRLRVEGRSFPVGFARLTDSPALHLLVTVDDAEDELPKQESTSPLNAIPIKDTVTNAAPPDGGRSIRFLWRSDEQGKLTAVSDEFLDAAGLDAAFLFGRTFRQLSDELGVEGGDRIAALLERRDTWSGRTVEWPLGEKVVPIDLAALPAYSRDRSFEGFRGFGVARFGDARLLEPNDFHHKQPELATDPQLADPEKPEPDGDFFGRAACAQKRHARTAA